jgi:hypothetical protein
LWFSIAAVEKGVFEELLGKYAGDLCNIASSDIGKLPLSV